MTPTVADRTPSESISWDLTTVYCGRFDKLNYKIGNWNTGQTHGSGSITRCLVLVALGHMLILSVVIHENRLISFSGYMTTIHRPENRLILVHCPEVLDADRNSKPPW